MKTTIAIGSDHAGFEHKEYLKQVLKDVEWIDVGPVDVKSVDYPDFAKKVCDQVTSGKAQFGILICGTGIGMSIAANKTKGIRAGLVSDLWSAQMTREHNDTNVLCLSARVLAREYAAEIARTWIGTPFSKDARHQRRIDKIHSLE